jgi:hypothetical protein
VLDFQRLWVFIAPMNLLDLTVNQLKRAAAIKEQIEELNRELRSILGGAVASRTGPMKSRSSRAEQARLSGKSAAKGKKKVSAATRAKLSAKLKAYWSAKRSGKK